jgi:very-short-patch-repair endonuclease
MPKKRVMQVFYEQIVLLTLALSTLTLYFTNSFARVLGFGFLAAAVILEIVAYEETPLGQTDLLVEESVSTISKQNEPTPQAKRLHEALNQRNIVNELEFDDGHKHVDISIPSVRLNVEIDGKYHLTDPEHLFRDLQRDSYSHLGGVDTVRIPNSYVDNFLDELADSLAEVVRKREELEIGKKPRRIML